MKTLVMHADRALPVVAEDVVERIISKYAATASRGAHKGKTRAVIGARKGFLDSGLAANNAGVMFLFAGVHPFLLMMPDRIGH